MGLIGMDTSQGEAQAERLRATGDGLGERHDLLDAVVRASGTIWRGLTRSASARAGAPAHRA